MKLFFDHTKIKKRLLLAEIILLLASVFIFRGLWMILDSVPVMHTPGALWISLSLGIIGSVLALRYMIKHSK
jgi:hypothetical protein